MQRLFIQRGHRRSHPILRIGEESDGGHRIKRALYIGIKRLWLHLITIWLHYFIKDTYVYNQGVVSIWKCRLTCTGNLIIEIRRYSDCLIFIIEFTILGKTVFKLKQDPDVGDKIISYTKRVLLFSWGKYVACKCKSMGIIGYEYFETR